MKSGASILVVEDDPNDVFLLRQAFKNADLHNPLEIVCDGEQAMEYLSGSGKFRHREHADLPGLVLLDLKMPRRTGFEVIEWMRHDDKCRLIPIVILSASALPEDVNRAYSLGANAYMVKPADFRALERLLGTIGAFWAAGEQPVFAGVHL